MDFGIFLIVTWGGGDNFYIFNLGAKLANNVMDEI